MPALSYSVTIVGNVEKCRTEAEISEDSGNCVGIVHEDASGWHIELTNPVHQEFGEFNAAVAEAKERLAHFVNRMGYGATENTTRGALALWLMIKDDGTAMGVHLGPAGQSKQRK
ncbi:MAG TPA: hypothetical protein VJN89_17165 [Candidatus Acidoferrum sp.]|nr:hypothetical protein [Candidatus Acidoferrum sp.]